MDKRVVKIVITPSSDRTKRIMQQWFEHSENVRSNFPDLTREQFEILESEVLE